VREPEAREGQLANVGVMETGKDKHALGSLTISISMTPLPNLGELPSLLHLTFRES
jgi:hypothetical protein